MDRASQAAHPPSSLLLPPLGSPPAAVVGNEISPSRTCSVDEPLDAQTGPAFGRAPGLRALFRSSRLWLDEGGRRGFNSSIPLKIWRGQKDIGTPCTHRLFPDHEAPTG